VETRRGRQTALAGGAQLASFQHDAVATATTASFKDFFRILFRHRFKMLLLVIVLVSTAVAVQFVVPKMYEGIALLKIDRHSSSIDIQPENIASGSDEMDGILTTEMELAKSDTVLRPVAEKFNLWAVEKQDKGMSADAAKMLRAAPVQLSKLIVKRPPNSNLINIIYRAKDPVLAANVANAIAESLVEHTNDSARASVAQTSEAVKTSLEQMRAKMDQANVQLAAYQAELGIVDPADRATVLSTRLKDLTGDLTSAQAERVNRGATKRQMQQASSLPPAQALAAAQVADQLGLPNSTALNTAVDRLNEANTQFANVKSYYGNGHPEYARAQQQVTEAARQVSAMVAGAASRSNVAFQQAVDREQNLAKLVEQTKSEVDGMQSKAALYDQLKEEAETDRKFYADLLNRTRIADINKGFDNANAQLFVPARPSQNVIFPKLFLNLAVAVMLSLLLGPILALLLEALDTKLSSPADVAIRLQLPVMATIPDSKLQFGSAANAPKSGELSLSRQSIRDGRSVARFKEALRIFRTSLLPGLMEGGMKTLQVTSAVPGEGKTTLTSWLALSLAQLGKKVLLIDADMRRPNVHRFFKISASPGLSEVLEGEVDFRSAIVTVEGGLSVLPAGPVSTRSAELVSISFSTMLSKVARDYDLVIVDCPPVLGIAETVEISRFVDGTILVVSAQKPSGEAVSATVNAIRSANGQILGVVMNRVSEESSGYGYGYGYGYGADAGTLDAQPATTGTHS